ncbi:hypothetical protein J6590_060424 [Homalodisca vitripennis]|nr:hypothetical protein J6590_060424 [Homalodisca vitripennis]
MRGVSWLIARLGFHSTTGRTELPLDHQRYVRVIASSQSRPIYILVPFVILVARGQTVIEALHREPLHFDNGSFLKHEFLLFKHQCRITSGTRGSEDEGALFECF